MSKEVYDLLLIEEYTDKNSGEIKKRFHNVGTAFDNQDGNGQSIIIPAGISLSGRLVTKRRNRGGAGDEDEAE